MSNKLVGRCLRVVRGGETGRAHGKVQGAHYGKTAHEGHPQPPRLKLVETHAPPPRLIL